MEKFNRQSSIFYILRKAVYIECEVGECNATNTIKLMIKKMPSQWIVMKVLKVLCLINKIL